MAECKKHPGTERVPTKRGGLEFMACPKCTEEKKNAKEGKKADDKTSSAGTGSGAAATSGTHTPAASAGTGTGKGDGDHGTVHKSSGGGFLDAIGDAFGKLFD